MLRVIVLSSLAALLVAACGGEASAPEASDSPGTTEATHLVVEMKRSPT